MEGCDLVQKLEATCCSRMAGCILYRAINGAMRFLKYQHCQDCWGKETEERTKEKSKIGIGQESQTGVKKFRKWLKSIYRCN